MTDDPTAITRIPLDIVATGTGATTEGVLVAVSVAELRALEAEARRLGEAVDSVRANHPRHGGSAICPLCLALLWADGTHPLQGRVGEVTYDA